MQHSENVYTFSRDNYLTPLATLTQKKENKIYFAIANGPWFNSVHREQKGSRVCVHSIHLTDLFAVKNVQLSRHVSVEYLSSAAQVNKYELIN